MELALSPAKDWIHCAVLFDGYDNALNFSIGAQHKNLDCYLLTVVERRFSKFYKNFKGLFPYNKDAVFSMVAPEEYENFKKFFIKKSILFLSKSTSPDICSLSTPATSSSSEKSS